MAKQTKKLSDLAKRRHVRSAVWRLPTGEEDVAALAVRVLQAELLVQSMKVQRDATPAADRAAQVALAEKQLTAAKAALDKASSAVKFTELPHDKFEALRLENKGRMWAAVAAASADVEGTTDEWQGLIDALPLGDFNSLLDALSTAHGLATGPSLGKGR